MYNNHKHNINNIFVLDWLLSFKILKKLFMSIGQLKTVRVKIWEFLRVILHNSVVRWRCKPIPTGGLGSSATKRRIAELT